MRRGISHGLALLFMSVMILPACRKQAWDEYYGRPAGLEQPIYQVLSGKGNFKSLLATIDKSGYKTTLSSAGYWTLFAPNDSAFNVYFKEKGISSVEQMDSVTCQKIVTYCIVYNAFKKDRIDDYQSNAGWVANSAFRRRTANYTGVYDATTKAGLPIKAIGGNRNNNGTTYWVEADNNNKYVSVLTDTFLSAKAVPAADYNYFYPNATFTGFNVLDASVVEKDIMAENGVIHVVNKVLVPLPSIDEYLSSKPEFSEFKKIFDKYLVEFVLNPVVTDRYKTVTGKPDNVYTKVFNSNLAFSLINENFLKAQDNDGQSNCYSLFAPNNTALLDYLNNVLLKYYGSLDALPIGILYDFVNAHMWQTVVWPSKFSNSFNYLGEPARFNPATDVFDKKILSNGFFYGTNKVQEANVFSTVYGKVYLNPQYSYMKSLLDQELKYVVSNPSQRFVLFMVNNDAWNKAGYFADASVDNNPSFQWRYIPPGGGTQVVGSSCLVRMLRIVNQLVVPAPNSNLENLTSDGVNKTYGGEFIRWNGNKIDASGNLDSTSNKAVATSTEKASNGTAVYIDRLLTYTELNVGKHIEKLGTPTTSQFNSYWNFLKNSKIYNTTTGEITGLAAGVFYTIFIPDNASILKAVNDGLLPGTGTAPNKVPNYKPTAALDQELVIRFIQYHFLNKISVGTDGRESGSYETLLRQNNGDPTNVFVNNSTINSMKLTDMLNRYANVVYAQSNYISNRCMIHLVDNYMKYVQ